MIVNKNIQPYFSIVIPAYNSEETISNTIKSILKQTYQDFQLIIVNDGSQDRTQEIIEQYTSDRIELINTTNGGPGRARNIGISKSIGKYLVLVDADDELERDNLEKRYNILKNQSVDLVIGSYITKVYDSHKIVDEKKNEAPSQYIANHNKFLQTVYPLMDRQLMYVIWNKVYKLEIIKENNIKFPSYKSCEDRLFNIDYFAHVNNCIVSDEVLYIYSFDGKNSLTNKFSENKFETFVEFYVKSSELINSDKEGFASLFLKGVMSSFASLHTESCWLNTKEKLTYIKTALKNDYVRDATNSSVTDSTMKIIFKLIFKVRNHYFHYLISWLVQKSLDTSPIIIERLKRNY